MPDQKDNNLSGIVSHLFEKIPYSVKLLIAGSQIFINTYFLQPEKAQAQQQVLVIPVQQSYNSEFYPTSLEQAKAQIGEVKKGFPSTPVNIYISPDYDVMAPGIRTRIINAADRLNQNFPGLFAIVQDSTDNGINFYHKDDAFGEVKHFYDQNMNLVKTNVSHSNFDMVFDRLLIRALGLSLSLDKSDVSESGILGETEKAIITTYLNLPNGTSMNIFESLVSDNIPPITVLSAPDSAFVDSQITLDASGTADDNSQIRKYFWQFTSSYNPNSVFSPDTTTTTPALIITPSESGLIRYAVVASDPTKNSSLATKEVKVKEQQTPQTYTLTINAFDVLLKDVVPDSAKVSNLEVLIKNSVNDTLITSGFTDINGGISLTIPAIQDSLLMVVRDEAIASVDSVNNLGNYFDINKKLLMTSDISDTLMIIPTFNSDFGDTNNYVFASKPDVHGRYPTRNKNFLHLLKWSADLIYSPFYRNTPDSRMLRWKKDWLAVYIDSTLAPDSRWTSATLQAIGDSNDPNGIGWENMTSFFYKSQTLYPLNIVRFTSDSTQADIIIKYHNGSSHNNFVYTTDPDGYEYPVSDTMFIENASGGRLFGVDAHEEGHWGLPQTREGNDPAYVMVGGGGNQLIHPDEGTLCRIKWILRPKHDLGIYLED